MIRPLHSIIHARPLAPERTLGSFVLPDTAIAPVQDAEVLAVGPGRYARNGTLAPCVAQVGQRVVFEPHAPRTWLRDGTLLLDDRDLVAVVTRVEALDRRIGPSEETTLAPIWSEELQPANDYVFVRPDPVPTMSAGGIALAHHTARSGDTREKSRRNQLIADFQALRKRWIRNGEPMDEQWRLGRAWGQGLAAPDRALMADAVAAGDLNEAVVDTRWLIAPVRVPPVNTGALLDIGPGAVQRNGERRDLTVLLAEAIETGRCAWRKEHAAVKLYFGSESVLALRAEFLLAGVG